MKTCLLTLLLLLPFCLPAQKIDLEKTANALMAEGRLLYRSEMASWYGTDLFLAINKGQDNIGGYFSYAATDTIKCIFFSKDKVPRVIGTICFDSTYNIKTASSDQSDRAFTPLEEDLYTIRQSAKHALEQDTAFRLYTNTSINLIPVITDKERKVYVLTAPQKDGTVIFGNDYLFTFDRHNTLKDSRKIHRNILSVDYEKEEGKSTIAAIHNHQPETGDFITPTDICTLMLYGSLAKWQTYMVTSKKYISIWSVKENQLLIMTADAMERILQDQKKRNKDR